MLRYSTLSRTARALLTGVMGLVCVSTAWAQQPAATLLVQVGQVSMLKDGNQFALAVGQSIKANQIVVTGDSSYAKFQVADGSIFEVFEKSQVTFRDKGGSWKDLLNVWIGHVKVYVQHLYGPNPTSVTSPTAVISVRGTVFDVVVEDDDGTTLVTVDEGAVLVRNTTIPGHEPILKPGDSVRVFRNQPLLGALVDHSGAAQRVLAGLRQGLYEILMRRPGASGPLPGGGAGTGTSGGASGDQGKNTGAPKGGTSTSGGAPTGGAPTGGAPTGGAPKPGGG